MRDAVATGTFASLAAPRTVPTSLYAFINDCRLLVDTRGRPSTVPLARARCRLQLHRVRGVYDFTNDLAGDGGFVF